MPQATVTINGREYDKHTGLPLDVARTGHQAMRQGAPSYTLPPLPADAAPAAPLPTAAPVATGPTLLTPERPAAMPTPERPTSAPQAPAVSPTAAPSSTPLASKRYEPIPLPPVEPTIAASDYKPFTAFTPYTPPPSTAAPQAAPARLRTPSTQAVQASLASQPQPAASTPAPVRRPGHLPRTSAPAASMHNHQQPSERHRGEVPEQREHRTEQLVTPPARHYADSPDPRPIAAATPEPRPEPTTPPITATPAPRSTPAEPPAPIRTQPPAPTPAQLLDQRRQIAADVTQAVAAALHEEDSRSIYAPHRPQPSPMASAPMPEPTPAAMPQPAPAYTRSAVEPVRPSVPAPETQPPATEAPVPELATPPQRQATNPASRARFGQLHSYQPSAPERAASTLSAPLPEPTPARMADVPIDSGSSPRGAATPEPLFTDDTYSAAPEPAALPPAPDSDPYGLTPEPFGFEQTPAPYHEPGATAGDDLTDDAFGRALQRLQGHGGRRKGSDIDEEFAAIDDAIRALETPEAEPPAHNGQLADARQSSAAQEIAEFESELDLDFASELDTTEPHMGAGHTPHQASDPNDALFADMDISETEASAFASELPSAPGSQGQDEPGSHTPGEALFADPAPYTHDDDFQLEPTNAPLATSANTPALDIPPAPERTPHVASYDYRPSSERTLESPYTPELPQINTQPRELVGTKAPAPAEHHTTVNRGESVQLDGFHNRPRRTPATQQSGLHQRGRRIVQPTDPAYHAPQPAAQPLAEPEPMAYTQHDETPSPAPRPPKRPARRARIVPKPSTGRYFDIKPSKPHRQPYYDQFDQLQHQLSSPWQ